MNCLSKDGLTGNSGFGVDGLSGIIHVSANYAATKDHVFVETEDMGWERIKRADLATDKRPVIRCSYCAAAAISLDHCWPYLQEATYCEVHRDWQRWMKEEG